MLHNLLAFTLTATSWIAILWFGIAPDFGKWSVLDLLAAHILPPVAGCLAWWAGLTTAKRNKTRQREKHDKKALAERQAKLEQARRQHEQEIQQRRFGCDYRIVAIGDLAVYEPFDLPEEPNVSVQMIPAAEIAAGLGKIETLDALDSAITEMLRHVYEKCPAAAGFPLYIVPPTNAIGKEITQRLRTIHGLLIDELTPPAAVKNGTPSIQYLPSADSAVNSIIGLFETSPDLPGAIVLAFDSPLARILKTRLDKGEGTPQDLLFDKPGHGAFALLVTHPELPAMLEACAGHDEDAQADSLTPFWEKVAPSSDKPSLLTRVPQTWRDQLGLLPVVARIHRAAFIGIDEQSGGTLELMRILAPLLEQAQINAGLRELSFVHDGIAQHAANNDELPSPAYRCESLIHNAGDVDYAGSRLASISNALIHNQIELNPIEKGINVVRHAGRLGQAMPIGMLAITLTQAQEKAAPALCAEFMEHNGIALAFAVPTPSH